MKKLISALLLLVMAATALVACNQPREKINVGVMAGPTGMGMAKLMSDAGDDSELYSFEVYSSPNDATAELANGTLDMLCLPTNTAAALANKTPDYISVISINTLGSLYLLTDGSLEIDSVEDLDGQTIWASVPNSTTGPIVNYLLEQNGVSATVEFEPDHDALVARVKAGTAPIVVLPDDINIVKHQKYLDENTMFAGGVWLWGGQMPWYSISLANTIPALRSCKEKGVKEVLATVWHNGAESMHMMCLPGLAWYADFDYTGEYNEESMKKCFYNSCGVLYDELVQCELLEHPHGGANCISKALLYNDPLVGLIDRNLEGNDARTYYRDVLEKLEKAKDNKDIFAPAYDMAIAHGKALEYKADFGVRLKKAYDAKDKEALKELAHECDIIRENVKNLCDTHRKAWMYYNKPFGWEVLDIRYGGIQSRFETAKILITEYLAGNIDKIDELEEERYLFGDPNWLSYQRIATVNIL